MFEFLIIAGLVTAGALLLKLIAVVLHIVFLPIRIIGGIFLGLVMLPILLITGPFLLVGGILAGLTFLACFGRCF